MELLKQLYKVFSPSENEKKMRKFIKRWIKKNVPDAEVWQDYMGNVYVRRGGSDSYPCVVAHIDQVQDIHSKDFTVLDCGPIFIGYSPKNKRQEGLGADDKNGIWVALKCLQKYDKMKCAFFVGEEIGCVGSSNADMTFFDDCRFVVQCDRRNGGDLITSIWDEMASKEFVDATRHAEFGYTPTHGAMTDVAELRSRGLKASAVNMSCGYYEPHTDQEFTVKDELWNCLHFVENIIENCTMTYDFEAPIREYRNFGKVQGRGRRTFSNDDFFDRYERWYELSDMEALMSDEMRNDPSFTLGEFYLSVGDMFPHLAYTDFEKTYDTTLSYMAQQQAQHMQENDRYWDEQEQLMLDFNDKDIHEEVYTEF